MAAVRVLHRKQTAKRRRQQEKQKGEQRRDLSLVAGLLRVHVGDVSVYGLVLYLASPQCSLLSEVERVTLTQADVRELAHAGGGSSVAIALLHLVELDSAVLYYTIPI